MTARILLAIATTMAATTVSAQGPQSYQFEVTGGWTTSSTDTNPDIDVNRLVAAGEFHFAPVELKDHPWNEAEFLEHSMYVGVNIGYTNFEIGSFEADGPTIGGCFRYARPDQPIAAEVGFAFGTLDGDFGIDVDEIVFGGNAGYWLCPNTIVGGEFVISELDAGGILDITETLFGAFGKTVHDLGDGQAVNAEAHAGFVHVDVGANDDVNFELGAAGDFYFTPQYSAGAMLDFSFGDAASREGVTFGVRGSAWFNPQAGVSVEVSTFAASDSNGADDDEFGVFGHFRF